MLQSIKKIFHVATSTVVSLVNPAQPLALALVFSCASAILVASSTAYAQDQSQPASSSGQQSGSAGSPSSSSVAPGTAALSKATAAALAPYTGPKYDNRWEVYGGLLYMNGQAGQNTPVRFDMGGAEATGTYWLTNHLGVAADGRFGAGTTPVISKFYNRVVVMDTAVTGGVQYRGPKDRYAALDFHAMAGGIYEDSTYAINHYPGGSPVSACAAQQTIGQQGNLGLYCDHFAPYGFVGSSVDFNESAKLAVRLQPDLTFEHLGTETREFFSISLGIVYRMGKR